MGGGYEGGEQRHQWEPAQLQADYHAAICSRRKFANYGTCPVITHLLELHQECVKNGVWVRVLFEVREKLAFHHKTMPPSSHQPGRRLTSERRRSREKRRREAWAESRRIRALACPLPHCSVGEEATTLAAPTTTVDGAAADLAKAVIASPLLGQCLHLLILRGNV